MSLRGHRRGWVVAGAAVAVPLLYLGWVRPRMLTWGATPEEVARAYPGDELVPDADGTSTMATTFTAAPDQVWPWLAQMGFDRGGWYSWDRLDRAGIPSATLVEPRWHQLDEGQRLQATPNGQTWFTAARVEPGRTLVLRSDLELPSGRSLATWTGPLPRVYLNGIWAFHLRPTQDGGSRLVVRTRGRSKPRGITRPFDLLFGEPAHFVMQTRQFHNLRTRLDDAGVS